MLRYDAAAVKICCDSGGNRDNQRSGTKTVSVPAEPYKRD